MSKAHEVLNKAATLAGASIGDVLTACHRAEWTARKLAAELEQPGWESRLGIADASKRLAEQAVTSAQLALGARGPVSMLELGREGLYARVPLAFRGKLRDWPTKLGNALLLGPTGCGKSLTATWLVVELCALEAQQLTAATESPVFNGHFNATQRRRSVRWARAVDLASARQRHKLGEGEAPDVERAIEAEVLIVDDLGWEREQDSTVREVLACRYDTGQTTVVTSGLTPGELSSRYGAAFVRRLIESGGRPGLLLNAFTSPEPDVRQRQAGER